MSTVQSYVFSVICTALLTGIIAHFSEQTFIGKQIKGICGIVLLIAILEPVRHFHLPDFQDITTPILTAAQEAVEEGERMQLQSIRQLIKTESEAYILKEAGSIGADVKAHVELDSANPPKPAAITICGSCSEASELYLSDMLERQFGIPKEHQTWNREECSHSEIS